MTRRLLQAIAGARHGGAETFFVRLAAALQRAGETQRVLIRRDPARSQILRAAGVEVAELPLAGRSIWPPGAPFAARSRIGGRISC